MATHTSPNSSPSKASSISSSTGSIRRSPSPHTPHMLTQNKRLDSRKTTFQPRSSRLDTQTLHREKNPFRGFVTFFWMALAFYVVYTFWKSWREDGVPLRLGFFYFMTKDGWGLFKSDMGLIASCFTVVPIAWLIERGWIPLKAAHVVQHTWQTLWFGFMVSWVFIQDWPWLQSGFFVMHAIAMLFKQHSYLAVVQEMVEKRKILRAMEAERDRLIGLQKRNADLTSADIAEGKTEQTNGNGPDQLLKDVPDRITSEIELLSADIEDLSQDLVRGDTRFPNNLTILNFLDYMLVPTLVYEIAYPRTDKFRPFYFFEKFAGVLGTFFLMYLTFEHYILPVLHNIPNLDFISILMHLIFPIMIIYFMVFFIIFEGICNAFAELTLFADREFYDDWWNSSSFDEFARKWNKPVHEFLLRHVYLESIKSYKLSKSNATWVTFLMSSFLHELVCAVVGKRIRLYLFGFQMLQIPLIYMSRIPAVKKQKVAGNALFWFGMLLGPALITTLYVREHYINETS
ncbi:hypothetical protein HK102_013327 [Quaeritorhiza haematococci]|nr:hypothetical protein HK102_013327 [Quaeritorhiza haematococci]